MPRPGLGAGPSENKYTNMCCEDKEYYFIILLSLFVKVYE